MCAVTDARQWHVSRRSDLSPDDVFLQKTAISFDPSVWVRPLAPRTSVLWACLERCALRHMLR